MSQFAPTGTSPETARAPAQPAAPVTERSRQTAPEPKTQSAAPARAVDKLVELKPAASVVLDPSRSAMPVTWAEYAAALKVEIAQAVALQKDVGPPPDAMVFAFNLVGQEVQVCAACGVVGHGFAPVNTRQDAPKLDMLLSAIVIAGETAKAFNRPYGLVIFDEEVFPIHDISGKTRDGLPVEPNEVLRQARAIVDRFERPDIRDEKWLKDMLAIWKPELANLEMVGEAAYEKCVAVTDDMFHNHGAGGGFLMAHSQPAGLSLTRLEVQLNAQGVTAASLVFGDSVAPVAADAFKTKFVIEESHDAGGSSVPRHIGEALNRLTRAHKSEDT
ncbi:MAG: hypothetical protein AAFX94_06345 [Myxococcota bacterium]